MCSDGPTLISSCLLGDIRVWDANSGDVGRLSHTHQQESHPQHHPTACYGGNEQYDPWSPQQSPPDLQYHHLTHRGRYQRSHSDNQEQRPKRRKSDLFTNSPNLTGSIDTDFVQLEKEQKRETLNGFHHAQGGCQQSSPQPPSATESPPRQVEAKSSPQDIPSSSPGYDFHSRFDAYYHEHASLYRRTSKGCSSPDMLVPLSPDQLLNASSSSESSIHSAGSVSELGRMSSAGELSQHDGLYDSVFAESAAGLEEESVATPIWCLGCHDNLVIAGCSNGRIEDP